MEKNPVYFVYDGECPICRMAATAFRVREAVGELRTVNAREEHGHPLMRRIAEEGLDLDKGMVVAYGGKLYHGRDALHMMALLGSGSGWFNRINARLFRSKRLARFTYPFMRTARNMAIYLNGAGRIGNLEVENRRGQADI